MCEAVEALAPPHRPQPRRARMRRSGAAHARRRRASAILAGTPLNAAYHNCSGKHAGFLSACVACGDEPAGLHRSGSSGAEAGHASAGGDDRLRSWPPRPWAATDAAFPPIACPCAALRRGWRGSPIRRGFRPSAPRPRSRLSPPWRAEPFYVNGTGGFTTEVMAAAPVRPRERRRRGRLRRRVAGARPRARAQDRRWRNARRRMRRRPHPSRASVFLRR